MIFRNNFRRFSLLALLLTVALAGNLSFNAGASARSSAGTCAPPPAPARSAPPAAYTVAGWGGDVFGGGVLNIPAGLTDVVAIAAGASHNLALLSDGTVVGWGYSFGVGAETPPAGLTDVTAISAGGIFPASAGFSLALKSDGTVVGWGDNFYGQTTIPAFGGCVIPVAISAGAAHSLALLSDGTVVGWGDNSAGQATPPAGLSNVTAISAGGIHSLALLSDGTVVGWGDNSVGQATPPAGLTDVVAVSAGFSYSLALKSDGTVVGWGNSFGIGAETPPAGLTNVVAISAGGYHSLALLSDGTVVGWGDNSFCQATPPGCVSSPAMISAGFAHSLAMQTDACVQIDCPVTNTAPAVTITGPASGSIFAVNTPVNFTGEFSDDDGDTHTATWTIGSAMQAATVVEPYGSTPGTANTTYYFTEPGVYNVSLAVTDNGGLSGVATTVGEFDALVVVYDPSAGWVTGGGWINSPAGAYAPNPSLTGKANFGFVSKYKNGASVPTGNTEFQFKAGNLNFSSTSYEWMVISGGKKAQYKGFGTINNSGNYRFMLTAIDGQKPGGGGQDKFRIRIWSDAGGLVYDNQLNAPDSDDPTTALGGGSIQIHN